MGWQLHDEWDHSLDGDAASVTFTGLAGAEAILLQCRAITKSVSGLLVGRVSVNDGVSFFATSGNYRIVAATGAETDSSGALIQNNATTVARSGFVLIPASAVDGTDKLMIAHPGIDPRYFVASKSPINAVGVFLPSGGNLTGGVIACLKWVA